MTPRSGIAVINVLTIGALRLDDGGLRLVTPENPDPMLYPALERQVAEAFALVDGHHVTAREAIDRLHTALGVPKSFVEVVSITGEEELPPLPDGIVS